MPFAVTDYDPGDEVIHPDEAECICDTEVEAEGVATELAEEEGGEFFVTEVDEIDVEDDEVGGDDEEEEEET